MEELERLQDDGARGVGKITRLTSLPAMKASLNAQVPSGSLKGRTIA
jgi:hypothetical protein